MPEVRSDVKEVKEEPIEEKKKGFFGRMKDAAADNESQLEAISTMVRLGILVWAGGILTLAYIKLPPALGIPEQKLDPTFIASVFTGVLATFGVQTAKKSGDGTMKMQQQQAAAAAGTGGITKADIEKLIAAKFTTPVSRRTKQSTLILINTQGFG